MASKFLWATLHLKRRMTMLKNGDRVLYVSGAHGSASNNPLTGTIHECAGTVVGVGDTGLYCKVNWDNGRSNSYNEDDLERVGPNYKPGRRALDPNYAFYTKKRGGR
jgi:hypothetical protein